MINTSMGFPSNLLALHIFFSWINCTWYYHFNPFLCPCDKTELFQYTPWVEKGKIFKYIPKYSDACLNSSIIWNLDWEALDLCLPMKTHALPPSLAPPSSPAPTFLSVSLFSLLQLSAVRQTKQCLVPWCLRC